MSSPRHNATSPAPSHGTAATFGHGGAPANSSSTLQPPTGGVAPARSLSGASASSRRDTIAPTAPPHIIDGPGGRLLCIADVRGNLSSLNALAREHNAQAIIHTGDFGFYEHASFDRISDRTLRHLVQYSTLISPSLRQKLLGSEPSRPGAPPAASMRAQLQAQSANQGAGTLLSELQSFLSGSLTFDVPVYAVWGACEDVAVLERFRTGEYSVPNLHVLDEATSHALEVGGVRLRLFGLGGAVVLHKLFDNGDGSATIAGGQGTMWTTVLQIGELIDTAQKCYDPTETRLLVTHASPGREGLLAQLALALKADLTISAGLHFRYGVSYNEFSVQHDTENFRNKLLHSKTAFNEVWEAVKTQVESVIDDAQKILLNHALAVTNKIPPVTTATGAAAEEPAWKNTWNWNLPDAAYGSLVLDIKDGRVSAETRSQGFNFAYRRSNMPMSAATPVATPAKGIPPAATPTGPALTASPGKSPLAAATSKNAQPPTQPAGSKTPQQSAGPTRPASQHAKNSSHGANSAKGESAQNSDVGNKQETTPATGSKRGSKSRRGKSGGGNASGRSDNEGTGRSDAEGRASGNESSRSRSATAAAATASTPNTPANGNAAKTTAANDGAAKSGDEGARREGNGLAKKSSRGGKKNRGGGAGAGGNAAGAPHQAGNKKPQADGGSKQPAIPTSWE